MGAVPPKLVRLRTEFSTPSTAKTSSADLRLDRPHFRERQLFKALFLRGGDGNEAAGDVMRLAERKFPPAHEPIGKIGGGGIARARGGLHAIEIGGKIANHPGHGGEAQRKRVQRIESAFLVFLQILQIGERQALHHDKEGVERANDPAGLGPDEFRRVGIALLRHDRRPGRKRIRQRGESELRRNPEHDLLGEAGKMNGAYRGGAQGFEHEIAIGHAVERIRCRPVEPKRFRGHRPVDRERGSSQRRGAERRFIEAGAGVAQS